MVLSHKVVVKVGGIHGFCWFAGEDIKAGEMIWQARSEPDAPVQAPYLNFYQSWEQIQLMPEKTREAFLDLAYQVADGVWLGVDPYAVSGPEREALQQELYINHSCDGSVWHESDELITARRDILKGEEITYDYALTESDPTWVLAERCLCHAADCRVKVCGNDWQQPRVQAKYGRHFLSYILKKIDARNQLLQRDERERQRMETEGKARADDVHIVMPTAVSSSPLPSPAGSPLLTSSSFGPEEAPSASTRSVSTNAPVTPSVMVLAAA